MQGEGTNGRVGYCLDVADLFMSKAAAGREKDRAFCMASLAHGHVTLEQVLALVADMPLDEVSLRKLGASIRRWARANKAGDPAKFSGRPGAAAQRRRCAARSPYRWAATCCCASAPSNFLCISACGMSIQVS